METAIICSLFEKKSNITILWSDLISEVVLFQVIAEHLSIDEVEFIRKMFMTIDTDNNGKVTFEELKAGLQNTNSQLTESEMILLMEAVHTYMFFHFDKFGVIS